MRLKTLTLLITVLAFSSIVCLADDWKKDFTVSGRPTLRVDANDAEMEVHSGSGNHIQAVITTRGYKIGPGDVRITDRQVGDRVELEVHKPSHMCFGICNQSVRIEIIVPRDADLNLHTGDGKISVEQVRGEVHLDSGDGELVGRELDGVVVADTRDGRIRLDGRFDRLDLHTGDGSIEAKVASGSKMTTSWSLRTGDGHITLRVPQDFAADLDAHTGDGEVNVDFPVTVSGAMKENTVRGKMNGGGQLLELRSGDGRIRLEKS